MICKKCDVYYEITDENAVKEIETCQCGLKMDYYVNMEDYLNCKAKEKSLPTIDRLILDYESAISRIVLQCLSEITLDLGIKRFMLVLMGKNSPFILKYKLDKIRTYSMLSNFTENQLRIIIDSLSDREFVEYEYVSEYEGSSLQLTENGKLFLEGCENIKFGFMDKMI